jgi:hypothetical protein
MFQCPAIDAPIPWSKFGRAYPVRFSSFLMCSRARPPRHAREAALTTASVDITPLHDWFAELAASQSEVDRSFDESVAALEAYQSHLDRCQAELAAERVALEQERAVLESERQQLREVPAGEEEQFAELGEARKLISELRDMLLERTEELRRSDTKRSELVCELQQARSRQLELEKQIEGEKSQHLEQQLRWTEEFQRVSERLKVAREARAIPARSARQTRYWVPLWLSSASSAARRQIVVPCGPANNFSFQGTIHEYLRDGTTTFVLRRARSPVDYDGR